jgi:hypothetical protein
MDRNGSVGRPRRLAIALLAAIMLAAVGLAPASAATYVREAYRGTDAWSYDDCGPAVDVTAEFSGLVTIRTGTGPDAGAFFVHDRYEFREVHVRRPDGKTAIVTGHANWKETRATHIEGDLFEFTAVLAGQPFTVRDADGNLVLRDRGSIRDTILFDTGGDDEPGGEIVAFLDSRLSGKFPSLLSDAFCTFWTADLD